MARSQPGEEIMTFRSPEGVKRQGEFPLAETGTAWHSCALFINDNVATQIDGLGHVVHGNDNHWYNGFKEADWGGDWGPRKCDATTIPPIIARGILIDVAGYKGVPALPPPLCDHGGRSCGVRWANRAQNYILVMSSWFEPVRFATGRILTTGEKLVAHDTAGLFARWRQMVG